MVRFGGMGDILLATPALRAVSETFDTDAIDVIVGRNMGDAVTGTRYVRRVTEWDKKGADGRLPNFIRFLAGLRRERYDLFLNFQPGTRSNLMAMASGAGRVITFRKDRRVQSGTGRVRHAIDDFTKELQPLGIRSVADRRMDFHIPESARESCRAKLADRGVTGRYLVVNPAATRLVNRYPPERFAGAINAVTDALPGVTVVLSGAPNERDLAD
ncbi:MAG: glycosyltransferase family 9 protein, partial [Akkermansiaceae bacterium]|nr:glycosyltransferase family 9 protein [Armatimonadota bacterium]